MTVQVRFEIRRRAGGPATALFVPDRDPAAVLAVCTRLGLDPSGRIYHLAGGFLLKLEQPSTEPMPGAIRLRERTTDFYLAVDGELVPALLDDEAVALVRDGGLVFLPGGRILRFDRRAAVGLDELVKVPPRGRRAWMPLPEPRRLAERITEIAWELPDLTPEALYQEFEAEIHRGGARAGRSRSGDEPDPGAAGARDGAEPSGAVGAAQPGSTGAGPESAGGLGSGVPGLIQSLGGWLGQAGAGFATLKEKIQWEWVDHSALVRKLLREFREGDPARALRRALPLTAPGERSIPVRAHGLPWSAAIYNLFDLLRRPGRGEFVLVRAAQPSVIEELAREYRKAAEAAVRHGDFRRAAYIYGILLRDDRLAAQALQRGGLHRDAATLYLNKLNDPAAAAQAFEAAGEVDRAIALYRQLGRHEAAGDLLRRIGEEEAAVAEYRRAAAIYAAALPPNHFVAGYLLLDKARRPDLALEQFQAGWDRRPDRFATLCGQGLARLHAERGTIEPLRLLLDEADAFFGSVGSDLDAGSFYNTTALLAARTPALGAFADEVRDRALLALAGKLGQNIERGRPPGPAVSALLAESALWPAALVRDAEFAAAARQRGRDRDSWAGRDPRGLGVQVGRGTVTAVCHAPVSGDLFLGFDNGLVLGFRPRSNQVVQVAEGPWAVTALAVDPDGQTVVALRQSEHGTVMSCSMKRPDGSFRDGAESPFPGLLGGWLTPVLPWGVDWLVGLGDPAPCHDLRIIDAVSGTPWGRLTTGDAAEDPPMTAILLPVGAVDGPAGDRFVILTHDGPRWMLVDLEGRRLCRAEATWQPAVPTARAPRCLPIIWRHIPPLLELVGVDQDGAVHAAQFSLEDGRLVLLTSRVATTEGGYLAATPCGTCMVAAVSRRRIDWLSSRTDRFPPVHTRNRSFPSAIACFPSSSPQEIQVVCSDGFLARVAAPRRVSTRSKGG